MRLVVLGMVTEMELNFIKERHGAGIAKAKAAGVYRGRAISLDYGKIKALRSQGLGPTAIAKQLGCSRNAVYRVIERSLRLSHSHLKWLPLSAVLPSAV